jgi:ATP-binding cassette subfamily B protein
LKDIVYLYKKLNNRYKILFNILVVLTIFSSLLETSTILLVIPFIKYYLLNQKPIFTNSILANSKIVTIITDNFLVFFISFIFLSFFIRIFTLKFSNKFVYKVASYFSSLAFSNILEYPFIELKTLNRSEILSIFTTKLNSIISFVFVPFLNIISSFFLTTLFLSSLFFIDYRVAFITIFLIGGAYIFLALIFKKIIYNNGKEINSLYGPINRVIIESLNSIRDLILYNAKKTAKHNYNILNNRLLEIQGESQFYHLLPRYFVELFSLILMILIALILKKDNDPDIFLPIIGAIAINIQKLVPSAQLLYQSWSSLTSTLVSLNEFIKYITIKNVNKINIKDTNPFHEFNKIQIQNISYRYDINSQLILNNLSFTINAGDIIGIIGESGSGKSTLLDILMGFIDPIDGNIYINDIVLDSSNNTYWQNLLSLVPQNIFLLNTTILENIVFSDDTFFDDKKMQDILKTSRLDEFVNKKNNGIHFNIGENGILLSGGQKQRIAIARALYKSSQIIIFDEPTSALDRKTSLEFIESIKLIPKNKTIIIVSHDKDLISICNKVIDFKEL